MDTTKDVSPNPDKTKTVEEMIREMQESCSLHQSLFDNRTLFERQDTGEYLSEQILKKHISKAELARRSGMSGVYLYQLLSGIRRPSRDRMICIGIGLSASLDEVQEMLQICGFAKLYARHRRDFIIMYGIVHQQSLYRINDALFTEQESLLVKAG